MRPSAELAATPEGRLAGSGAGLRGTLVGGGLLAPLTRAAGDRPVPPAAGSAARP